jgi:hypothetical protein
VLSYRVPTRVVVAKFVLAAVVALAALIARDRLQTVVGLAAAAGLLAYAVRDVLTRERLRADDGGVTIARVLGGVHLSWPAVERIQVDSRLRLGARTELLEIDAGDHVFQFSRFDLGVSPAQAAEDLAHLRRA